MSEERKDITQGRPPTMKDPRGFSVMLDEVHRRLIESHVEAHRLHSQGAAVRDIIEKYFNVDPDEE